MIDARNFAKAKRNIFKIQLKREPRRKRKTVSCGMKINHSETRNLYFDFCVGIKSFDSRFSLTLSNNFCF